MTCLAMLTPTPMITDKMNKNATVLPLIAFLSPR
jgi:hypothetical protein